MSYQSGDFYSHVVENERELSKDYEREQLERRHAWKTWLAVGLVIGITWIVGYGVSAYLGTGVLFALLFLVKDFDPVPKEKRRW